MSAGVELGPSIRIWGWYNSENNSSLGVQRGGSNEILWKTVEVEGMLTSVDSLRGGSQLVA